MKKLKKWIKENAQALFTSYLVCIVITNLVGKDPITIAIIAPICLGATCLLFWFNIKFSNQIRIDALRREIISMETARLKEIRNKSETPLRPNPYYVAIDKLELIGRQLIIHWVEPQLGIGCCIFQVEESGSYMISTGVATESNEFINSLFTALLKQRIV